MSRHTLKILSFYVLRAFLCCLFVIGGIFVISVTSPFGIYWCSGFVLMGLGMCGIILQLFFSAKDYYSDFVENHSQK